MRFPIIKVRDKISGREHIVGQSTHDQLEIINGAVIVYNNLQNGDSTGRGGCYEFVGIEQEYPNGHLEYHVEFVTFDELSDLYLEEEEKHRKLMRALELVEQQLDDD